MSRHVIEFGEAGWTLQHPLACRPVLFDCPVNKAAERAAENGPVDVGRYVVDLDPALGTLHIQRPATDDDLVDEPQQTGFLHEPVRRQILAEVLAERDTRTSRQPTGLPDGTNTEYAFLADTARDDCAAAQAAGTLTWLDLLQSDHCQVEAEEDPAALRGLLLKVAGTALAWVEDIDSRDTTAVGE